MAYIVYMGSLPEVEYPVSSHHISMLQEVVQNISVGNFLIRSYRRSFNGFAAKLTNKEAKKLARPPGMKGVVSVFPSITLRLLTTRSWDFMGFNENFNHNPAAESDVIIGVLDTGIWPESASFQDEVGTARDDDDHGSHSVSTAAGNKVKDASFFGLAQGTARGAVPSARIAAYKVCHPEGAFHAIEKGILTLNSAGNDGLSGLQSVASVAPWMVSVAASSTDRQFIEKVILGEEKTLNGFSVNSFNLHGTKFPLIYGKDVIRDCSETEAMLCEEGCVDSSLVKGKFVLLALSNANYDFVKSYVSLTKKPEAEILKSEVIKDSAAPVVATFFSRGPNFIVPDF
ncbi:hypothetical protein CRYUN_Cryun34aG0077300 [Craigia yunnanensis]